jgi:nucleoside transporter
MNPILLLRLWIMVFLQYGLWGTWYVTMGTYLTATLGFTGGQVGLAYGTTAVGAMVSPFFVGMVADRFFATERILAFLHALGAALLWGVSLQTSFPPFYTMLLAYTLCLMATLALTNALTLHQLENPDRHFPLVMLMGSVGWIAAGILIGTMGVEATAIPFRVGSCASMLMAVYCLTLPHTPPKSAGQPVTFGRILGLDALRLFRDPSFAVFAIGSFLICIPLSFYFSWTNVFLNEMGITNAASKMTLGQVSDVFFLILMPFFLARLGTKRMLLLGMLMWSVRFLFFYVYADRVRSSALLYAGILVHGICYDFFFVMGRIYVDRRAPVEIRGTAQGLIAFITLGAGMFVGTWLSGIVGEHYTQRSTAGNVSHDWGQIWLVPAMMAAAVLVMFALSFRDAEPKPLVKTTLLDEPSLV